MKLLCTLITNVKDKEYAKWFAKHNFAKRRYNEGEKCTPSEWKVSNTRSGIVISVTMPDGYPIWIDGGLVIPEEKLERARKLSPEQFKKYMDNIILADKYNL